MDDIKLAMLGSKEAAKRLTDAGIIVPCSWCGKIPEITVYNRWIIYRCDCGVTKTYPGYLQTKKALCLRLHPNRL
jgi:hypothetical protein